MRVRPDALAAVSGTGHAGTFTLPIPNQVGVLSDAAAGLVGK